MGIDIDTSRKWMDLHHRIRGMTQGLLDQAAQSGDYSQVQRVSALQDRMNNLGDHHVQEIQQAQAQDQGGAGDQSLSQQPQPPQSNLPALDPQALGSGGNPQSAVHEATRGAVKGAVEALKSPAPIGHGPGEQSFEVGGLGRYAPGELSFRSDFAPWNAPEPKAATQDSALPTDGGDDSNIGAGDLLEKARKLREGSALPSNEDQEVDAYLKSSPAERQAEMKERLNDLFHSGKESSLPKPENIPVLDEDGSNLGAGDLLEKARKLRGESALPDITGLPADEESEEPESQSTLPDVSKPAAAEPSEADEGAQIDKYAKAAPALIRKYQNNGVQMGKEFIKQAAMTDMEREYARRVMNELGPRPKLATVPKMLAAFSVGVGAALGGWISGKYNGAALMDVGADQREWDRQRAEIGREVYQAHQQWDRVAAMIGGRSDKVDAQEKGKNDRQQMAEAGKTSRMESQEGGKNARLDVTEAGKNERQKAALKSHERVAAIRATAAKKGDQMSIADKAELSRLGKAYGGIDRTLMTVDPKVKKQGDDILAQMEEIIQKYREPGK